MALESKLEQANAENDRLSDKVDELNQEIAELKKAREAEKIVSNTRRDHSIDNGRDNISSNDTTIPGKVGTSSGHSFNTSYYGMDCAGCSGITASGLDVSDGTTTYKGMRILAADTSILPLHSIVIVTNPDGSSYKGIIKDRGGAIKGYKLDVLVGSEAEASNFGRHPAKVEIVSKGDNKYRKE